MSKRYESKHQEEVNSERQLRLHRGRVITEGCARGWRAEQFIRQQNGGLSVEQANEPTSYSQSAVDGAAAVANVAVGPALSELDKIRYTIDQETQGQTNAIPEITATDRF
jgi:hypothetical protein